MTVFIEVLEILDLSSQTNTISMDHQMKYIIPLQLKLQNNSLTTLIIFYLFCAYKIKIINKSEFVLNFDIEIV